jgi:hypothetical protein
VSSRALSLGWATTSNRRNSIGTFRTESHLAPVASKRTCSNLRRADPSRYPLRFAPVPQVASARQGRRSVMIHEG